ncbi:MAG: DUF3857 domain-containing protein [Candidatus Riflebacteria bacterium]|nr:DUF3857 domain-containing protein [Candidatus Riflebacteria bacterium]
MTMNAHPAITNARSSIPAAPSRAWPLCAGQNTGSASSTSAARGKPGPRAGRAAPSVTGLGTGNRRAAVLLLLVLLCGLVPATATGDVLTLNNGDELFGTVASATPERVAFEVDGKVRTFTATEVLKLELEVLRMPPGEDTIDGIKDSIVQRTILKMPTAAEFPEATRVDVLDEERYDLAEDGTWTHAVHRVFVVLKEAGRDTANTSFPYFPDLETFDLEYGRAISPGKAGFLGLVGGSPGTVRYVSDRTIADESDFATVPLYQRRHTVKFAIPEVGIGTIVEWKYRVQRTKADPMLPFYAEKLLRGNEPCQVSRLVVSLPAGKKVSYKVEENGIPVEVRTAEEGGRQILTFEAREVPPVLEEPQQPSLARLAPRVVCALADDWKAVAAGYAAELQKMVDEAAQDAALRAIVGRLTRDGPDPLTKARWLFLFLGKEFTHVGVHPQAFSYRPHPPLLTFQKKQGSLLDLAFLYHTLLTIAGVDHRLALARDKDRGAFLPEVPSLGQADFLVVELPGATAPFNLALPIGDHVGPDVRLPFLQGAAGVYLPDGAPLRVPFCPPEGEGEVVTGEGELRPDGSLRMQLVSRPTGNGQAGTRTLKNQSRDEIRVLFERIVHARFPGARLLDVSFENLDNVSKPLVYTFEFEVPDFALRSGSDLLVFPMPLDRDAYSANLVGAPRRLTDLAWGTLGRLEQRFSIRLPPGFTLHALPEGVTAVGPGMVYGSTYGYAAGTLTFRDLLVRERDRLTPADYPLYKRLIEARAETTDQLVVIRK